MRAAGPERQLVEEIRDAYDGSAAAWATGPASVYRHLAAALIGVAPGPLAGARVLDLGTGTGVASEVLSAAGARPIGLDLAPAMLAYQQAHRPSGVAGDAHALPFRDGAFDAVVAAFSLNHVPAPGVALGECRRVVRSGGVVLASSFPNDAEHPAKAAVEGVLERFGYERPRWYRTFKDRVATHTGDPRALAEAATQTGLVDARVMRLDVEADLHRADLAVAWRLNMPHTIGFVSGLDARTRAELEARAIAELSAELAALPSSVPMLALRARVV